MYVSQYYFKAKKLGKILTLQDKIYMDNINDPVGNVHVARMERLHGLCTYSLKCLEILR